MGRRKIEMKMVKDTGSRQVTFSKRRSGLFKKANELATLCAAQVAIVVFSPGGKPYSFGYPTLASVAERFLNQESAKKPKASSQEARLEKLNKELSDLQKQIQIEKKKGEFLDKAMKENGYKRIDEMSGDEVVKFKKDLEALREKMKGRVVDMEASSSLLLLSKKEKN
ncbi:agamous-like MADS-box protein AGL29 [Mercurialis annua]|uniref:agamous-like MADS-box protein AGL29 n=1 Tax=Mercurialis annua TaxID=3986 RepID=UPI00215EE771|nr:agamous-like MADS-box protein AGL29 [Mercurialis annua]